MLCLDHGPTWLRVRPRSGVTPTDLFPGIFKLLHTQSSFPQVCGDVRRCASRALFRALLFSSHESQRGFVPTRWYVSPLSDRVWFAWCASLSGREERLAGE